MLKVKNIIVQYNLKISQQSFLVTSSSLSDSSILINYFSFYISCKITSMSELIWCFPTLLFGARGFLNVIYYSFCDAEKYIWICFIKLMILQSVRLMLLPSKLILDDEQNLINVLHEQNICETRKRNQFFFTKNQNLCLFL